MTCVVFAPLLYVQHYHILFDRMVGWITEEVLDKLVNKKSSQETGSSGFGANIKINPPVFIDYSQVKLPEKSRQRHKSIDIKYQPPQPVKGRKNETFFESHKPVYCISLSMTVITLLVLVMAARDNMPNIPHVL